MGEVLDPAQLRVALVSSIAMAMTLLVLPEPISKAFVLALTVTLVAYLGWDTVVSLIEGWRRMDREARQARTFSELREAGERYGRVMGEKVTRLLLMVATAALGSAGGKALGGMNLPGFTQASRMAATESGLVLSAVGQVHTVKVTGRILTVSMAPNALAMTHQGMSGRGQGTPSPAKYRLSSIESWRKPRLTEEGQILPFKRTREPPTLIPNLGRNRAGQTMTDGRNTLRFDKDGFPEFEPKFETLIDDVHIGTGKPQAHFRAANERLSQAIQQDSGLAKQLGFTGAEAGTLPTLNTAPAGYRWHHHQDVGRMQLILEGEHRLSIPHTGGMAIWGGGYPR
ncbi:HNH endonuclease [Hyalangium rubrum]|uniref:HNH endonuclease n=1 Tax=Hyalangium rubrum TaxID=3103134 RepID=A0ABU5H0K0_9BACT|nr:HNH endonuclease [Hyalangium sp. s54d21]MDY7226935.1 HNH endonuclease [Hyalangium sp. s54d21]